MVSRSRIRLMRRMRKGGSGLEALLETVDVEVTAESVRAGAHLGNLRERMPDCRSFFLFLSTEYYCSEYSVLSYALMRASSGVQMSGESTTNCDKLLNFSVGHDKRSSVHSYTRTTSLIAYEKCETTFAQIVPKED